MRQGGGGANVTASRAPKCEGSRSLAGTGMLRFVCAPGAALVDTALRASPAARKRPPAPRRLGRQPYAYNHGDDVAAMAAAVAAGRRPAAGGLETGRWYRMGDAELEAALTPFELHTLYNPDPTTRPQDRPDCSLAGTVLEGKFTPKAIHPQLRPMLAGAEALRRRWSGWRGNTMHSIATRLAEEGRRLIFAGDSMAGQLFRAAVCDLVRHGAKRDGMFEVHGQLAKYINNKERTSFRLPGGAVFEMGFQNVNKIPAKPRDKAEVILGQADVLVYNEGLWYNRRWPNYEQNYAKNVGPFLQAMHEASASNHSKLTLFKESSAQHFFSFAGDGSWEAFNRETLSCWKNGTKEHAIPDFSSGLCNPRSIVRTCAPTTQPDDWRNRVVRELMATGNMSSVPVLRWFNYTVPLWDMHGVCPECVCGQPNTHASIATTLTLAIPRTLPAPLHTHTHTHTEDQRNISTVAGESVGCEHSGGCRVLPKIGGQDCTHFVYSPFLYEPLWDEIAAALDAQQASVVRGGASGSANSSARRVTYVARLA